MENKERFFEKRNIFLMLNLALTILIIVGDCLYMNIGTLAMKSVTSALFVLLGILNLVYLILERKKKKAFLFPSIMLTGLVFAMLGDIILEVEFIVGAALFAIGHVFYFVAYCFLQKFKWSDLIYGVVILVPSILLITLAPFFDFGGVLMEIVCVVYAIIISLMVGKAVANFVRERNWLNLLIVIGSILFFFSDLMLLLNVFASLSSVVGTLCLATYYPAEILLACSIFMFANSYRKEQTKLDN